MIKPEEFYKTLINKGLDTFFGVPDSLLKDICAYITSHSKPEKHIITANEGNAVAMAAGYYLATSKPAVVYMQNSGLGNAVNPLLSLADELVYKIPMLLIIGWRGEPGVHDEPQHIKQGMKTLSLLETMDIEYAILTNEFEKDISKAVEYMKTEKKAYALVIKKNTFSKYPLSFLNNNYAMSREEVIEELLNNFDDNGVVVSTTGKTSREIFECREKRNEGHEKDFLTVGSMGHAASIAFGISLKYNNKVYCIDGDGSMIMHMGSHGIIAKNANDNYKYILINNGAHESVGGQPTIGFDIDIEKVLIGLGFEKVIQVSTKEELNKKFKEFNMFKKTALVINVKIGSKDDLGRPTKTPQENKEDLMRFIKEQK